MLLHQAADMFLHAGPYRDGRVNNRCAVQAHEIDALKEEIHAASMQKTSTAPFIYTRVLNISQHDENMVIKPGALYCDQKMWNNFVHELDQCLYCIDAA